MRAHILDGIGFSFSLRHIIDSKWRATVMSRALSCSLLRAYVLVRFSDFSTRRQLSKVLAPHCSAAAKHRDDVLRVRCAASPLGRVLGRLLRDL